MFVRKPADIASSEITPKGLYLHRRAFLKTAGLPAAAILTRAASLDAGSQSVPSPQKLAIGRRMVTTSDPLTPYRGVTTYNNFYEFGTDKADPVRFARTFKPQPWSVTVDGECAKPGAYAREDILKGQTLEERIYRMRCVEGWSMVIPWVGFPLGDLVKRLEPNGNAKFVEFTTVLRPEEMPGQKRRFNAALRWPYKEGLRLDEAMHPLTILAVGLYGETLLNQNGAPLRLVVPWKYGFKGIKSIVRISFVRAQPKTSWQEEWSQAYGFYSNVNPRVDHPGHSQAQERRLGEFWMRGTLMFNGYGDQVASLYSGMDLRKFY